MRATIGVLRLSRCAWSAASAAVAVLLCAPMAQGSERHSGKHGRHGNPEDLEAYIGKMEAPDRAEWQKPDEVLRAVPVRPGQSVCDIGAGPGFFALRAARLVGASGHVWAVDVEARILSALAERIAKAGARNVTPVLALPDDPLLPPSSCDVVLVVDTFHHFPDGTAYLRKLARLLRPGGRLVNIDFHKRETPVGPDVRHRVAREDFLRHARDAGLAVVAEPELLPYQYFFVLQPAR